MSAVIWIIVAVIVLAGLVALFAWFYERATNEVSLVRTGIGGRRVVIDGGVLALPYFHEIARVNMQTLRLLVERRAEASIITKDRLRVDVGAEFYVSVAPEEAAIARAAQTLGRRSFQPDQLRELLDGMLVDSLRSVAARLTLDELHENRGAFVAEVRDNLREVLERYGLQLDSVSLTALDQTPFAALDENNAFNAVGMRKLAEVIAKSKKERAEIDGETQVSVRRAAMETAKRQLEIDLEERRAEISQSQEIETLIAAQLAEVARRKAEAERDSAAARIRMEQEIQAAEIAREQAIREAEIARARVLEEAEQERAILISRKSQEESAARAEADSARARATAAHEEIETARASAEAERRHQLALMAARAEAEAAAARARIAAENDKVTAADRAEAARLEAQAMSALRLAEVEVERARIEAENTRSEAVIALELEKARLEAMPRIVAEMVKPAEKIGNINITQLSGLGRGTGEAGDAKARRGAVDQALDAVLDMAVQLPVLRKIGDQVGLDFEKALGPETNKDKPTGSGDRKKDS
ncbi:flotillin family protein [Alkalilacustris brevis]|uniref:flotillin family protein n=1 Tax=Alkalilacustris brevis TaxID=2026338 RepID=UPI000E0D1B49|nr:flotillin domain-containing protein [Alkalilacustris brevis]